MSTANFWTMKNFPLYAISSDAFISEDEEGNSFYDEWYAQDFYNDITEQLNNFNDNLVFHKISLKSGYYDGIQLYVETIHDEIEDIEKCWNNEDCRYQFELCKSKTIRKFRTEINKVNKILMAIAKENGFNQYNVSARFSNGETWYSKATA